MVKSKPLLARLLNTLTEAARRQGFNDTQWAAAAGLPKETLSRLRRRISCDLSTLEALAGAVHSELALVPLAASATVDGLFPRRIDRTFEERLLELSLSGDRTPANWSSLGPAFFMAGLAVMLAGVRGMDREPLLRLAERLHVKISEPQTFQKWLDGTPLKPSRFLPLLRARRQRAA
jgi:hypothetical protein